MSPEQEKPMISLVLLLREPRHLEANILARIVSLAWGGDYSEGEDADGFVTGEAPLFAVHSPHGFYMVNTVNQPYFEDIEGMLDQTDDLPLRTALQSHRAWISVDLIHLEDEQAPREGAYNWIAKLTAELSGPDCVAIFQPESGTLNVWSDELEEKLRGANALEEFELPTDLPLMEMSADDPRIIAAAAEARARWPEFVEAFRKRDGQNFAVKARVTVGNNTEFVWIEVVGLEPEVIHGTLGNDPLHLGNLKLGDPVNVPVRDLHDWGFLREGEPFGLFTVKAGRGGESIQ